MADPGHGLGYDPEAACRILTEVDPMLGRLIERIGPFTLQAHMDASPFETLLRAIVYQQLTGKAAGTIHGRVLDLFEGGRVSPGALIDMQDDKLRGAGLSRNKTAALKDLADKALDRTVPGIRKLRGMTDEQIVERLTAVRGVGRWTVEMLLIFRLGRPDVLPVDDLGVRKGYAIAFGEDELPKPKALAALGERWAPYRSVASWYFWRAAETATPGDA